MARREVIQLRCSEQEKEKWNDAAAQQGQDLSSWIRLMLDRATRPGAPLPQQPRLLDLEPD
jgi:antitoxin component of RelBE/YafQ-DinJ toxin-antitoxin module